MYDDGGVVLDPDCSDFGPPHALPDELELTPPGAELGQMLAAAADRSVLSGPDLLLLTQARARQIAHLQAELMADLVAIAARCQPRISEPPPGSGRRAEPVDHAVDEIAANLTWTNTAASKQLDFAERLVEELPEVHTAMLAGHLDWPKARVLADGVTGLDPETARTITALLLPGAAKRTTGQLRARLAKLIILADPDAAQRRYRQGLKGRRVEHGHEDDGTARLTGRWLPAARAAAANSRIQAIADWLKDGGDHRTIDQIRADILLDLLQGLPVPGPDGQDPHHLPGDPDQPGIEDHPDHEINGDRTDDHEDDQADDAERADAGDHQPGHGTGPPGSHKSRRRVGPRGACPTCGQTKLTRGLELTAPVTTLLGLADHPGQLGSWGPVIAEATRALIADLINAPWRISLTDDRGQVIWHGPVRTRPDPGERRRFPTPTQAAHVRARDRRCRFPGCRRPASRAELDHSIPHAHEGPTHECNLCCLCVRHHVLKTAGLWVPWQQDDGTIHWRSHLGGTYRTKPEPVEEPR